jgi:hypothetical protein
MTLMEAVVALAILALVAVGCLELTQGASQLETSAVAWDRAVSIAESRMAQVVAGAPPAGAPAADDVRVTREAWRPGLDLVLVSVPVIANKHFVLRQLVPSVGSSRMAP